MIDRLSSDEILVKSMTKGDSEAFRCLFDRYWQNMYAIVFSVSKDKEVCLEIVHDIFLNVWLKRDHLQIDCFKGYILASARYHAYRYMKSTKRNSLEYRENLEQIDSISTNDGESNISYQELEQKVERHLEDLPKRCKEIFTLSRMSQLSNDEIASRLDISKRTVENQLTHALKHLRLSIKHFLVLMLIFGI